MDRLKVENAAENKVDNPLIRGDLAGTQGTSAAGCKQQKTAIRKLSKEKVPGV